MKLQDYIQQGLLLLLMIFWGVVPATAQDINSLSPSLLPTGSYVTGLYYLEADDNSGLYIKENASTYTLAKDTLDVKDPGFYFWAVENVYHDYFQLYSATQDKKLMQVNSNGSVQWTGDATADNTKLLFRMYTTGAARTAANATAGIVARGYITTDALVSGYGNGDCKCNFLTISSNTGFRLHNSEIEANNYRIVTFENTDSANTTGTITEDTANNVTSISQTADALENPYNFVSSNFYVGGFGEDDFQITVSSGAEGYIGFLEYTDHHYTKEVYKDARSPIGIRIEDDVISLVYRSGDQLLPTGMLSREVEATNISVDTTFTLGFKDQGSLVISQGGNSYELDRTPPAELYFNQSVTQTARMLVSLVKGTVEIAYTTKNRLINSENDKGTDSGTGLISTRPFFPYNDGDNLVNTFDWQQSEWDIRYVGGSGTVEDVVFSPFYENSLEFSGIAAGFDLGGNYLGGEDFAPSEGWELIKANLGYNADGTARPQAPTYPYIMLYDRVGGTLRVFVYANNQGEANQLNVSLSAMGNTPGSQSGYVPKLWGSLQQFTSMDQVQSSRYSKVLPFYSGSGRSWYFADFVMEYDPCITFFESTIELEVEKVTEGGITMIGRLEGGSIPAGTDEYDDWQNQRGNFLTGVMDNSFGSLANTLGDVTLNNYEAFDLLDFQTEVEGTLTGAAIEPWEKEKARIEWEAQETIGESTIAQGVATIAQGAAQMAEAIPVVESGAKVVGGLATIAEGGAQIAAGEAELRLAYANKLYYDAIKDKVKHDDQAITMSVPPPRPQAVFGEMALNGTLTISTILVNDKEFIATPGGLNTEDAPEWHVNGSRGSEPLYNRPMGKFALLKQPEFGIGIVHNGSNGGAWLKTKKKPYFAHNNTATGKIDDVLTLSIHVQTLDADGAVQSNVTVAERYTNAFGMDNGNSLPGEIDISDLIDWSQIQANVSTLTNTGDQAIENELSKWIRVSYEVWSLTLTTLKSRDLKRVMADGNNYYTGNSSFSYNSSSAYPHQLKEAAKTLANSDFSTYNFSDDTNFGTDYTLYHTSYDKVGDTFYSVMNSYCSSLSAAQSSRSTGETQGPEDGEEEVAQESVTEEFSIVQPGLSVYPNPARNQVNFRLVSEQAGKAGITLHDLTGRALVSTNDMLNGRDTLQGRVNISSLPAGIYILKIQLPDGNSITKKIIKR